MNDLGVDLRHKGHFDVQEVTETSWQGRSWRYGDYIVGLIINNGLHLTFNAIQYFQAEAKSNVAAQNA